MIYFYHYVAHTITKQSSQKAGAPRRHYLWGPDTGSKAWSVTFSDPFFSRGAPASGRFCRLLRGVAFESINYSTAAEHFKLNYLPASLLAELRRVDPGPATDPTF